MIFKNRWDNLFLEFLVLASYEEYLQDGGHPRGNNNQAKGLQDTPVDHTIDPVRSISVLLKCMNE